MAPPCSLPVVCRRPITLAGTPAGRAVLLALPVPGCWGSAEGEVSSYDPFKLAAQLSAFQSQLRVLCFQLVHRLNQLRLDWIRWGIGVGSLKGDPDLVLAPPADPSSERGLLEGEVKFDVVWQARTGGDSDPRSL